MRAQFMVEIPFLFLEGAFTAIWLIIRIAVWMKQKKIDWKREIVLLLMYINLAVILRFTFFPMSKVDGHIQALVLDTAAVFPFRVNLIPLVNLFDYDSKRDLLLNVIGNAAMFVPSGIVLPIVYKGLNTHRKVISAGIGISLCIEILQLPFYDRVSDIDDLLLNSFGFLIGYLLYLTAKRLRKKMRRIP